MDKYIQHWITNVKKSILTTSRASFAELWIWAHVTMSKQINRMTWANMRWVSDGWWDGDDSAAWRRLGRPLSSSSSSLSGLVEDGFFFTRSMTRSATRLWLEKSKMYDDETCGFVVIREWPGKDLLRSRKALCADDGFQGDRARTAGWLVLFLLVLVARISHTLEQSALFVLWDDDTGSSEQHQTRVGTVGRQTGKQAQRPPHYPCNHCKYYLCRSMVKHTIINLLISSSITHSAQLNNKKDLKGPNMTKETWNKGEKIKHWMLFGAPFLLNHLH